MTAPTRDRVREAREAVEHAFREWHNRMLDEFPGSARVQVLVAQIRALEMQTLDAYRDALLDAVDEDVADVASKRLAVFGADRFIHLDAVRAAIRARKETT